jgi:phosphoglycolate phosphatase-like HAD superfamily hydrolase
VPDLLKRVRSAGLKVAVASSAIKDQLEQYLEIAGVSSLVDEATASGDVEGSKPAPDVFEVVLNKMNIIGADAAAVGDTPYDAEAARKTSVHPIGLLSGGFIESALRRAGCVEVYPGPASIYCCFEASILGKRCT